jgi:hypothetical protein
MKTERWLMAVAAGLVLLAASGYALAQPAPEGPPGGPPRRALAARRGPPRQGLGFLRWGREVDVEVIETDDGVVLKITPKDPEKLEQSQDRLARATEAVNDRLAAARERLGEDGPPAPPEARGLFPLLLRGSVELASQETDEGVTITLRSEDAEIVERLHERVPEMVERAGEIRERAERRRERRGSTREALALLAEEEVAVTVEETDDGITVAVSSEDPEVAEQIRERLPAYFEGQKGFARQARRWRRYMHGRRGPEGPRGFGPQGRHGWRGYGRRGGYHGERCPYCGAGGGHDARQGRFGPPMGYGPQMGGRFHMGPHQPMHGGRWGPPPFAPGATPPWAEPEEHHEKD